MYCTCSALGVLPAMLFAVCPSQVSDGELQRLSCGGCGASTLPILL